MLRQSRQPMESVLATLVPYREICSCISLDAQEVGHLSVHPRRISDEVVEWHQIDLISRERSQEALDLPSELSNPAILQERWRPASRGDLAAGVARSLESPGALKIIDVFDQPVAQLIMECLAHLDRIAEYRDDSRALVEVADALDCRVRSEVQRRCFPDCADAIWHRAEELEIGFGRARAEQTRKVIAEEEGLLRRRYKDFRMVAKVFAQRRRAALWGTHDEEIGISLVGQLHSLRTILRLSIALPTSCR